MLESSIHLYLQRRDVEILVNVEGSLVIASGIPGQIGDVVPLLVMEVFIFALVAVLLRDLEGNLVKVVLKTTTRVQMFLAAPSVHIYSRRRWQQIHSRAVACRLDRSA